MVKKLQMGGFTKNRHLFQKRNLAFGLFWSRIIIVNVILIHPKALKTKVKRRTVFKVSHAFVMTIIAIKSVNPMLYSKIKTFDLCKVRGIKH